MVSIRKYFKIILTVLAFVILTIASAIVTRKRGTPTTHQTPPDLKNELRAINAEADAQRLVAQIGAERAAARIENEHRETLGRLEGEWRDHAEKLRKDPAKLAAWLVHVGRSR